MKIENNKLSIEAINSMISNLNDIKRAIEYIDSNGYDNGYFYPLMDAGNCINDVKERLENICITINANDYEKD